MRRADPSKKRGGGFSLVEVVLALGVVSFALLALVALIPMGIKTSRQSLEEGRALNLLGGIVSDRGATPPGTVSAAYGLPALTNTQAAPLTGYFYVGDDYRTNAQQLARYRIDYRITPPTAGRPGPFFGWFKAGWPAAATAPESSVEIVATFPQP